MMGRPEPNFSLSGLKTAVRLEAEKIAPLTPSDIADLCASFQAAVVDMVVDRTRVGLRAFREIAGDPKALVVAGGVAANQAIRDALQRLAVETGLRLVAPPLALCTDNGAMIAWAGLERLRLGLVDDISAPAAGALAARLRPATRPEPRPDGRAHRHRRRGRLGNGARQRGGRRRARRDPVDARGRTGRRDRAIARQRALSARRPPRTIASAPPPISTTLVAARGVLLVTPAQTHPRDGRRRWRRSCRRRRRS